MKECNLKFTKQDSVAGYLGIYLDRNINGEIELKQVGLVSRILYAMNLESCNGKETPAELGALGKFKEDMDCEEIFNYASVVGMLIYLQSYIRPDITFAVSQC